MYVEIFFLIYIERERRFFSILCINFQNSRLIDNEMFEKISNGSRFDRFFRKRGTFSSIIPSHFAWDIIFNAASFYHVLPEIFFPCTIFSYFQLRTLFLLNWTSNTSFCWIEHQFNVSANFSSQHVFRQFKQTNSLSVYLI